MHKLTLTLEVDENDDEIEHKICELVATSFVASVELINYNANNFATSNIRKEQ